MENQAMNIKTALGNRVRRLREQKNMKQYQLAEEIDRSIDGLSLIERGENWPSAETVDRLAHAFNIPVTDLFDNLKIDGYRYSGMHMARARGVLARLPENKLLLASNLLETLERFCDEEKDSKSDT